MEAVNEVPQEDETLEKRQSSKEDALKEIARELERTLRLNPPNGSPAKENPFTWNNSLGLPFFSQHPLYGGDESDSMALRFSDEDRRNSQHYD